MEVKGEDGLELVPILARLDLSEEEFCKLMHLPLGPTSFDFEHNFVGWLFGMSGSATVSFKKGRQTHFHHRIDTEPERAYEAMKENLERIYGAPQITEENKEYQGYPGLIWKSGGIRVSLGCHNYWDCMITSVSFDKA